MKVYQIISEASFTLATPAELSMMNPQQRLKYNRMKIQADQAAATQKAIADAKAAADKAARRTARKTKAADLKFKKDNPVTTAANAAGKSINKTVTELPASAKKLPAALQKKIQNYLTYNTIGQSTVVARIAKVIGPPLKIFKWIGWYDMIVDYYKDRELYDGLLEKGNAEIAAGTPVANLSGLTDKEWQYVNRLNTEQLIVNITISAFFPKIIKLIIGIISGWSGISRIGALLSTPFTAGVSLALLAASEVAIIYFQNYLESPDGKKMVANWIAGVVDPAIDNTIGVSMLNRELKKAENIAKTDKSATAPNTTAPNTTAPAADAEPTQADKDASAAWKKSLGYN